ncbi:MAG: SNF2-related protein [Pseudomonadota bacterium]
MDLQGRLLRLDRSSYALIEAVEEANSLPAAERNATDALRSLAQIRGLAEEIGVQLDRYLAQERVIIPAEVGVGIEEDHKGRISFVPQIDGVPDDALKRDFLARDDTGVYSLTHPDGGQLRVVLGPKQREALNRMRWVRLLSGEAKARVLANPAATFEGLLDDVIRMDGLGPRVKDIGNFPFIVRPRISYGVLDGILGSAQPQHKLPRAGLEIVSVDASTGERHTEHVDFANEKERQEFTQQVKDAARTGQGCVQFRDLTVQVEPELLKGLDELEQRLARPPRGLKEEQEDQGRYLLIYTNEEEVDYPGQGEGEAPGPVPSAPIFEPPQALLDTDTLTKYQQAGIAWLQLNYRLKGRRGCLLADDMGLGKTLQILNFVAWLIEQGSLLEKPGDASELPPWNPVLVVAPVMLLEVKTWVKDMQCFFRHEGNVFQPYLVLHGQELQRLRQDGVRGRETQLGEPILDLEKLRSHRVVLTNYETVVNYQHSLARIKWAAVVTDEAQEFKTPSTKISHALKSLDPRFRVALTGTPVETRLLDVWNIFDFLQPGHLRSAKEFCDDYERHLEDDSACSDALNRLKKSLAHGEPDAFILRRNKTELKDLPPKHEHEIYCQLSDIQRQHHLDLVRQAGTGASHHFSLLSSLMFLYQHPDLELSRDRMLDLPAQTLVDRCPKLSATIEVLSKIRRAREKALIFTRSIVMQQAIAKVLGETFGLNIDIINGATKRHSPRASVATREQILQRFREHVGFHVLVLSPEVAGLGLTIVEANHVIHYGRWWNPAKESQATDRVYRIGQKKDVHVYYPIAQDPLGQFKTFDEKLDDLLKRRRQLATDFLMPIPDEERLSRELAEGILCEHEGDRGEVRPLNMHDIPDLAWDRFEALVGLLEHKQGRQVILTPRAGDQGIDVIAADGNDVRLIQCKHTAGYNIHDESVAETIEAFDGYRARYLRGKSPCKLILSTNGGFTESAGSMAYLRGVQLVPGADLERLLDAYPVTFAEIETFAQRRCKTMKEVRAAIQGWRL